MFIIGAWPGFTSMRASAMHIESHYEPGVYSREIHSAIPSDTPWSPEQVVILNDFAWWLSEWSQGMRPTGPRMVIEAVAGSGKTTVLKAMLAIVRQICPHKRTMASAFNRHIAQTLREAQEEEKARGLHGAEVLGGSNTMNAGGYRILRGEARRRRLTMGMESSDCPKYRVLSRQVWAEYLGEICNDLGTTGGYDWPLLDAINESMSKHLSPRQMWFRVSRDIEKLVTALQDEGFTPSDDRNSDQTLIEEIVKRVGAARGLEESVLWLFPSRHAALDLAREVLRRGRDHAFTMDGAEIFDLGVSYAVVPRNAFHRQTRLIQGEGRYDTGLYPLWRMATRGEESIGYWASKAQVVWPPMRENWKEHRVTKGTERVLFSFTDQIWLPHALDLKLEEDPFQIAFIDEIQDLSVTKGDLYRRMLTEDAALVLVGDCRQAIMGWSGATPDSVKRNAEISSCISYPMTYCWRGGHKVAESAKRITQEAVNVASSVWPNEYPDYRSHSSPTHIESWREGVEEKRINEGDVPSMIHEIRKSDPEATIAVVSRLNGALAPMITRLVSAGIPIATPDSKEILVGIDWVLSNDHKAPVNKHQKSGLGLKVFDDHYRLKHRVSQRCALLEKWCFSQAEQRAGGDKDAAKIEERYTKERDNIDLAEALLRMWIDTPSCQVGSHIEDFETWVKDDLFGDDNNPVYLTSVHRYKGAEADYVFLLRSVSVLNRETKQMEAREIYLLDHQVKRSFETAQEECNILYVASTRARKQNIEVISGEKQCQSM